MTDWTLDNCCDLLQAADDTLRPGGLELTARLLTLGDFSAGSRVLDAGCGTGATLRYLAGTRGLTAVGVDCSRSLLLAAREESGDSPLVCAALEKLPFAEGSFDGIICECVLSQTAALAVLAEFSRVLRPGGRLLISDLYLKQTGCLSGMTSSDDLPATGEQPAHGKKPARKQHSTREQISAMLANAGFTVMHWEDRTAELRQLALRLIMAPGSAPTNLFGWSNHTGCSLDEETKKGWKHVGYHLLVARRTTR